MNASMYRTVVGADFDRLAPAVRRFHSLQGRHLLRKAAAPVGCTSTCAPLFRSWDW